MGVMALRTLLWILTIDHCWSEAPRGSGSAAILHLDEGNDWVAGFHPRRLSRGCHQRILLKRRSALGAGASPGDSRRLARRLFEEVGSGLEQGSWHHLTRVGIDIAEIRCGQDVNQTMALIKEKLGDQLDFVELDEEIYMPLQAVVDPVWPQQWGAQRVGFENAWTQLEALEVTPSEVVVALIDTGFNFLHEDIQGRVWVNEGEIAGNGIDDDGNGFVDDVNGFNFVDNNGAPEDDSGHGTHNAGIIAAQVNNLGVAGAAGRNQMVKLMIVKALTANGGFKSDAINALNYAMAMGAEISSNSWGGHSESLALQTAIQVAMEAGHLFVSAAGNDNRNADLSPFYPCVYPHVLCVAASDDQDQLAFFSNYGAESVELVAPGQSIISTYLGDTQYASLHGTSFGTSMVAGAAALLFSWLRSATNTVHSVEDIRWLLLETAEKLSWTVGFVGNGMLDVDAAASKALSGVGYSWLVGPWSLCRRESCSSLQGIRLRNVSCVGSDGTEVDLSHCSEEAECQDTVRGWRDSYDATCSIYESYNWCTSTGNYASGWLSSWGSFADYARDGFDATQVCCACGSGTLLAGNVPFASQECPEPIGGPDANSDGLDDCIVPLVTTTATSATATTSTDTTVTVTTLTMTSQTGTSSTMTSTGTSTMTSSTATTHTETTTSSSTTATSTSSSVTSYSTITSSSTSSMSSTSSTATITSHTQTSTSSSTHTRTTSTSSSFTVSSTSTISSSSSSSSSSRTSSSTTSQTKSSSSTTSSTFTRTTSSTVTSSTTSTTTLTSTSSSKTFTSSTSSTFTITSTTSSSTTLTVELAAAIGNTDFVRSTLLLVGTNQTPAGIDDALAVALAESFQMQRSSVEVLSVKAAVAAMFGPTRRLEAPRDEAETETTATTATDPRRLLETAASLKPALETDFQILLPEGSRVTVDEALEAIQAVRQDPQALLPVLGEVVENYGLTARENVSLRFTMPSADRVESVFVASLWGDCAGGAVCSNLLVPLRSRAVWCARVSDLAAREPDGFCGGARPRSSEPCPEGVPRPPACGWQISNWSLCAAPPEPCTGGRGVQRREAVCLSVPPEDCGATPETERECQCLMDATVTLTPLVAEEGTTDESILLPAILGSLFGLGCCCCLACLCGRRKVKVDVRPDSTEAPMPQKAVALAECEKRQISTKDLEDLLKESQGVATMGRGIAFEDENPQLEASPSRVVATPPRSDRASSPVSPSRIQHMPAQSQDGIQETKPRASPSEVSTQQSTGSSMSSKSSTGDRPLEHPDSPLKLAAATSSKEVPKPPPLLPELLETPMEASQSLRPSSSRSSAHPLRKTATWSSNVASPKSRSPTRSRTTLSHLADTSRSPGPPRTERPGRSWGDRAG